MNTSIYLSDDLAELFAPTGSISEIARAALRKAVQAVTIGQKVVPKSAR